MKRIAILAALLMAVTAYGGNLDYSGSGDVSIRSHDRVVVITLDTNDDGWPRAFVAATKEPRAFPAGFDVMRIPHVVGVAHHWGLKPNADLKSLTSNW